MEKRFDRANYPFEIFEKFGLNKEMLLDLPDKVHDIIERGGKSPVLPLRVVQEDGSTACCYARFALVGTDEGTEVLFYPRYRRSDLSPFTPEERAALMEGKVIVADVNEKFVTEEGVEDEQRVKSFVQFDAETNSVVYAPSQPIARNLKSVADVYGLSGDDLQRFWIGDIVTVSVNGDEDFEEPVTIGVDLNTDTGVVVVPGIEEQWKMAVRHNMPEYSFGEYGCWVNRDGRLRFVYEEHFTLDIINALAEAAAKNEKNQRFDESISDDGQQFRENNYNEDYEDSRGMSS